MHITQLGEKRLVMSFQPLKIAAMGDGALSNEAISSLIAEIYEGVEEPEKWRSAMRHFLDLSGGYCAFLGIIDSSLETLPETSVVGPESSRLESAIQAHRDLFAIDPGLPYALQRPQGGNFRFSETSEELTSEPQEWRDFVRHNFGSGDYHSRFSAEHDNLSLVLALHTFPDAPALTREQEQLHGIVFSHLERAARLAHRPPDPLVARRPLIIARANGKIVNANAAAESVISRQDGLSVSHGCIRAAQADQDRQLQRLIQKACTPASATAAEKWLPIARPSGAAPWLLRLAPLPRLHLGMKSASHYCTIEIYRAAVRRSVDPETLRDLFGLTRREAEIASLLAGEHGDLPSVSQHLGISHETARTHLRSALLKCGVASQVELVRVLANLA